MQREDNTYDILSLDIIVFRGATDNTQVLLTALCSGIIFGSYGGKSEALETEPSLASWKASALLTVLYSSPNLLRSF